MLANLGRKMKARDREYNEEPFFCVALFLFIFITLGKNDARVGAR